MRQHIPVVKVEGENRIVIHAVSPTLSLKIIRYSFIYCGYRLSHIYIFFFLEIKILIKMKSYTFEFLRLFRFFFLIV